MRRLTPTLILVGDADMPSAHAHAGAIESGNPRARRIVMPGAGRPIYVGKPAELAPMVIAFTDANAW